MAWEIRPSVRLSVCRVCRLWCACTLLRGFNFSGIFLHHIVAWPSGNSPTKNHEDRPMGIWANLSNRRVAVRLL